MSTKSLGTLTLDLIAKIGGFEQGMDKAARVADQRMQQIEKRAKQFGAALGIAIASAYAGISVAVGNAIRNADRLDELSQKLQISTETLSKWGYAAKMSGSDVEELSNALVILSRNVTSALDPKSKQAGLFSALGIEVLDANKNLRSIESLLPEIANAFQELDNQTLEASLAMDLFGRSGASLLEFLNRGSGGITELGDKLSDLGGVIDSETAAAAANFNDELDNLREITNGYATLVAAELLPALTDLVKYLQESAKEGGALRESLSLLGDVSKVIVSEFKKADDIGKSFKQTLDFISISVSNLKQGFGDLGSLDLKGFVTRMMDARTAARGALIASIDPFDIPGDSSTGPGTGRRGRSVNIRAQSASPDQNRLSNLLDTLSGGKSGGGGKSEAEKEAESLARAYESLTASMSERIALFNTEGEAAKVAYDVEHGALKGLDDVRKQELIGLAEQYDAMVKLREENKARMDAAAEETNRIKENRERIAELISDMQFEVSLLFMGNQAREKSIALRYAGAEATDEERAQIEGLIDAMQRASQVAQGWDSVQRTLSDSMYDAISNATSLKDAVLDFFEQVHRQILRMITDQWSEKIVDLFRPQSGGGSNGGGWMQAVSGFFGSLFSGGRAIGGGINPGRFAEINEQGFEAITAKGRTYLMAGDQPIQVTPNNRIGGGQVMNNFSFAAPTSPKTQAQVAARVSYEINRSRRLGMS